MLVVKAKMKTVFDFGGFHRGSQRTLRGGQLKFHARGANGPPE